MLKHQNSATRGRPLLHVTRRGSSLRQPFKALDDWLDIEPHSPRCRLSIPGTHSKSGVARRQLVVGAKTRTPYLRDVPWWVASTPPSQHTNLATADSRHRHCPRRRQLPGFSRTHTDTMLFSPPSDTKAKDRRWQEFAKVGFRDSRYLWTDYWQPRYRVQATGQKAAARAARLGS